MGGTVTELLSEKPSGAGIPAHDSIEVAMDVGDVLSEPILLAGRKVVSLQSNTALTSTNITLQGANFSSRTTKGPGDYKDGLLIPLAADFNDLYDKSDAPILITATTGQKIWALPDFGFPIWIRLKLSVAQTKTFYLGAKG